MKNCHTFANQNRMHKTCKIEKQGNSDKMQTDKQTKKLSAIWYSSHRTCVLIAGSLYFLYVWIFFLLLFSTYVLMKRCSRKFNKSSFESLWLDSASPSLKSKYKFSISYPISKSSLLESESWSLSITLLILLSKLPI